MTNDPSVTRTYRTAIKLGEDYVTLEETITVPVGATDDEIAQAGDTSLRVFGVQHERAQKLLKGLRDQFAQDAPQRGYQGGNGNGNGSTTIRDPDAPATEKQRNFIARLQEDAGWSNEQLAVIARQSGIDLVDMTKGQASQLIEILKSPELPPNPNPSGQAHAGRPIHVAQPQPRQDLPTSRNQPQPIDDEDDIPF